MNSRTKSKVHPASATAPAEGAPVVPQCSPALTPAGQRADGRQSFLTTSSKRTEGGVRSGEVASATRDEYRGRASCCWFIAQTAAQLRTSPKGAEVRIQSWRWKQGQTNETP